jgi:hypothetical protein
VKELVKNIIYCSDGRPICVTPEVSGVQQNVATCELNEKKDKMSLDVSICTDNEEFIKSKTLVIYVKK